MSVDIAILFERYEWSYEVLEPAIWRSRFAGQEDEDFDLYVMQAEDWIHFAVSPFLPRSRPECAERLHQSLLRLNQQMRLARFGLDEDGDVNLLADLPSHNLAYERFALALDTLVHYTQTLAHDLARTATEPDFHSSLF